jgi:hypothetical protein
MSIDDLTIREATDATSAMVAMMSSAISHTLEYVKDPDHDCNFTAEDLGVSEIPEFDDWDVQVILSFEESLMKQFKFLRSVLISQGYDISTEVST